MKEVEDKVKPVKKVTIQDRKYNARLYPFYKMCAWDLLFYYAIAFVFLVQTKGMSPAEVMLTDATYPFLKLIFQTHSLISPFYCIMKKTLLRFFKVMTLTNIYIFLNVKKEKWKS